MKALISGVVSSLLVSWIAATTINHVLAQSQQKGSAPLGPMPYIAIDKPEFVSALASTFLMDDDIVVGVASRNVAKAYPAADLFQHGSVDDQMPDAPIEVTWCSTCNTAAVFRAEVDGRPLHFDYDSMVGANEVHRDRETGSRWQQSTGEAISGPLKGTTLELYPFVRTTWKEWRRRYPATLVLKPQPGYAERLAGVNRRIKQTRVVSGTAPDGAFGGDDRLPPKETVAGLAVGDETMACSFTALRSERVINTQVGGVPVVVVHQPESDTTTAFGSRVNGRTLQFMAVDVEATTLTDRQTASTWDAYGLSVRGPLKGTQLKQLILVPEFWFAWSEFHSKTRVWTKQ